MRVRSWIVAAAFAVAGAFLSSSSTAGIKLDLTGLLFTSSATLDTTQVTDLR